MTKSAFSGLVGPVLALCALISLAHTASMQTWVSGAGNDSNTCTRTAPCATFAYVYSQTSAGGEIGVLNPGDFGGLTNASNGVNAVSGASSNVTIDLVSDFIALNGFSRIQSDGTNGGTALVTGSSSTLSNNSTGVNIVHGGLLNTLGNNQVTGPSGILPAAPLPI